MALERTYSSLAEWEEAQKKKKKNQEEPKRTSNSLSEWEEAEENDIAPVKGGDKDSVFKSGGFSDGVDGVGDFLGDLGETVLGTVGDIGLGIVRGAGRLVEGVTDLGLYGASGLSRLFGADEEADRLKEAAQKNTVDSLTKDAVDYVDQYSVLGNKADMVTEGLGQVGAIILTGGAAGAAGLGTLGATALTTGVTGLSGMGSGMSEAYEQGATDEEAFTYGLISGTAEAATELLFGGLGKASKAIGVGKSAVPLDDLLAKKVTSKFSSQIAKNFTEFGIKASAEGTEEVLSGILQAVGKKATYMDEKEFDEILQDENLLEQFVVGAVTSGIAQSGVVPGMKAGSLREANKTGRDFITGYTKSDQTIIDNEVASRVAEKEKNGKKLTKQEIGKIEEQVQSDLEKGYISIDTIESTFGGNSYTDWKNEVDNNKKLKAELDELRKIPKGEMNDIQTDRLAELKGMNLDDTAKRDELRKQLDDILKPQLEYSVLQESYNEKARRGQSFEADLTKIDEKQRATYERAMNSGIINNTNRSKEFVSVLAKIEADKGITFDFANNDKLKESGFAIEGKTINGFHDKSKGSVTINVESSKALNYIVGQEITHVLEGTEAYNGLREALYAYAESKGELESRKAELTELYKDLDADIDAELTADLVGDYLFADNDFIKHLTGNENVFKRIYNEIKYLCKVATGKQLTEVEKVKREFDKVWKEYNSTKPVAATNDTFDSAEPNVQFSLRKEAPPKETGIAYKVFFVKDGKLYPPMVANPDGADTPMGVWLDADVGQSAPPSKTGRQQVKAGGKGTQGGSGSLAFRPGWHLGDLPRASQFDRVNPETGKKELFPENFVWAEVEYAKDVDYQEEAMSYGYTENGKFRHAYAGLPKLPENGYYRYRTNPKPDTVPWIITGAMKVNRLLSDTEVNEILEKNGVPAVHRKGGDVGLDKFGFDESGKVQYSLSKDTNGNELSIAVQKRFENSKAVDENGDLKVLYHGTYNGEFYTFDKSKGSVEGDFGSGFYFTDNESDVENNYEGGGADFENKVARRAEQIEAEEDIEYSEAEQRAREELYVGSNKHEVYLNIENPAIVGETNLFDYESFAEEYDQSDYDSEEDWESDVEQHIADVIDQIIWDVDRNVDVYNTDGLAEVLWNAVNEGGIDIEQLKANINNLYLEDSNGNLVGNEVTRQIIESLGYDGIIDNTVSQKFNMGLSEDTTHYIVFKPNQIKSITNENPTDNPDIRYSVSKDKDNEYMLAVERGDTEAQRNLVEQKAIEWGAYLNNEKGNSVFKQDGKARIFYHGTPNDFTVFDPTWLGATSGDLGYFGKGHYFAFSSGEASFYSKGGKVIPVYLKMQHPFVYDQLYKYEGGEKTGTQASDAVWVVNMYKQFPEIVGEQYVRYTEKYSDGIETMTFEEFAKLFDETAKTVEFTVEEIDGDYGTEYLVRADKKRESFVDSKGEEHYYFDYGFQQRFLNEADANNKSEQVFWYLTKKFGYLEIPRPAATIQDLDFSKALQERGYDGVLQSEYGDEVCVFDSNQIKSAEPITYDNNGVAIPLSERFNTKNNDIRYSISNEGETSPFGTPATAIRYEPTQESDIAPVAENAPKVEAPMQETEAPMPNEIAPMTEAEANAVQDAKVKADKTVDEDIADKLKTVEKDLAENKRLQEESAAFYNAEIERLSNNASVENRQQIERLEKMRDTTDAKFAEHISKLEARAKRMKTPQYGRAMRKWAKMKEHAKWAEELLGNTATWVDKKIGLQYSTNTERRNLRDIVRDANGNKDIARADAIDDALNGQYNREEAAKNRELAQARGKYADLKITKAEDTYIQMLGEFRHNPETTLTQKDIDEYYQEHQGNIDAAKVDKVIEMARKDYDEWINRVNAELRKQGMREIPYRKGYFPHFTEPKQNFLQKLLNWKTQDNEIPTSIAGLTETFRPTKSWQSFDKTRHGDTTDYSFMKGFDSYSQGVLDWIYHIDTLQKRRAVENHIRFTHSDEGIKKRIKEVYANEEMDANEAQAQIEHILSEAKNPLNNFVQDFTTHTNILAGKKNSLDRAVEQSTNRHIYSVMTNVQNRMSANMVLANVRSALTNFIPITQSWAQVSPLRSLQATKDTIKNAIKDDGLIDKSTFLTNRLKPADNLYKTGWDKVLDKAGIMFEVVDNFSSQVIWRSKYNQNISDGMTETEAIQNADQFAENVMAGRSKGNEPTLFNAKNPLVKAFTMFQLEVNNQYGYLFKDVPNDLKTETNHWKFNLAKGYTTAFIGAYVYNELLSKLTGSDAALDPIGIIEDLLNDLGFGDDEEKEPAEVVTNLMDNVVEELPFVGGLFGGGRIPISSALPYSDDGIKGAIEDISEGNWANVGKEMMNPLLNIGLPVGGGQIKKTTQGLGMFSDEHPVTGSYTDSGALRFPVEDTPANRVQAAIFGQYASENAREYFDNGYAPLKEKQIQEYTDVDLPIADYWKYREGLKGLKSNAEKADYINSLDIQDWQKNLLMNNILDRKEDVDMSNYDDYGSFEEFDFAQKYPNKHAFAKSVGGYSAYTEYKEALGDIKADKDEFGDTITGSRKEKVLNYINGLDADYETKLILFKSQYPSDDTYNHEIINYLNEREDISYEEMVSILTELGFTVKGNDIYWD